MNEDNRQVTVTDIDMPFMSMVKFMLKWAFATIPAAAIFVLIWIFLVAIFGGMLAGLR